MYIHAHEATSARANQHKPTQANLQKPSEKSQRAMWYINENLKLYFPLLPMPAKSTISLLWYIPGHRPNPVRVRSLDVLS